MHPVRVLLHQLPELLVEQRSLPRAGRAARSLSLAGRQPRRGDRGAARRSRGSVPALSLPHDHELHAGVPERSESGAGHRGDEEDARRASPLNRSRPMSGGDIRALKWRCRRGMRELDLVLDSYLRDRYAGANALQQSGSGHCSTARIRRFSTTSTVANCPNVPICAPSSRSYEANLRTEPPGDLAGLVLATLCFFRWPRPRPASVCTGRLRARYRCLAAAGSGGTHRLAIALA